MAAPVSPALIATGDGVLGLAGQDEDRQSRSGLLTDPGYWTALINRADHSEGDLSAGVPC